MTDSATVCVKLVTPLDGTVEFLTLLGDLFRNFGIHLRGETGEEVYLCRSANQSTGQYSTFRKKSWGQLAPKFLFLVAKTSILGAKIKFKN